MNETDMTGLTATLAYSLPTYAMLQDMTSRGKVLGGVGWRTAVALQE